MIAIAGFVLVVGFVSRISNSAERSAEANERLLYLMRHGQHRYARMSAETAVWRFLGALLSFLIAFIVVRGVFGI